MIRDLVSGLYDIATVEAAGGNKATAVRLLGIVQEHPLSHHTRTFSLFSQDPKIRFYDLAKVQLERLWEEIPLDIYTAALADGRALELDMAIRELLEEPKPYI
jgi:hypothetical protein